MSRTLTFENKDMKYNSNSILFESTGPLEKRFSRVSKNIDLIATNGISSAKKLDVKLLKINGSYPSKENISKGLYPYFRPLYFVFNKRREFQINRNFINFFLENEGQKIIAKEGSINLKEGHLLLRLWKLRKKKLEIKGLYL